MTADAVRLMRFGSWSVEVVGPAADLDWLLEFLDPWFSAAESADRCVRLVRDDARLERAAVAEGDPLAIAAFELDQQMVRLEARRASDGSIVAVDPAYRAAYVVAAGGRRIDVLARGRDSGARTALMRVVREGAIIHARRTGQLLLHAAAVHDRHGCLLLAGRKNSGKTSFLLHLLRRGDTAFLANDRVAISAGGGALVAQGIPTVIGIDAGTRTFFPGLADTLHARGCDHRRRSSEAPPAVEPARRVVSPRQLCDALGVQTVATAPVRAIVFPVIRATASGLRLQRLDEAAAGPRLAASLFGTPPFAASKLFAPADSASSGGDPASLLARLAREVPCFDGIAGPDAYRSEVPLAALVAHAEVAT